MTEILLGIIAVVEIIRLLILFKPTSKKAFFKSRLKGVQQNILDLEFKIFKTRELREAIRRGRDDFKMRLETLLSEIETKGLEGGLTEGEVKACLEAEESSNEFVKKFTEKGKYAQNQVDEFKRLLDKRDLLNRDIKRKEDEMQMCDNQVDGASPSSENPHGAPGITDEIDSLVELKGMLKDWIKRI